jgi:hypothetical protein
MSKVISAAQADYAKNAYQATIASMALEAQKLNQAGDMIIIDPSRHYVIMAGVNQDLTDAISIDLLNRVAYNLTVVPPAVPEEREETDWTPMGIIRHNQQEARLADIQQRLASVEQRLASVGA